MESATGILITDDTVYIDMNDGDRKVHALPLQSDAASVYPPYGSDELVSIASDLGTWLRAEFPGGITCRLIIPSSWSVSQTVTIPVTRGSDQAALFEFERMVPVALEEVTSVVLKTAPRRALVTSVRTAPIQSFLATMERHGVFVESITPDWAIVPQLSKAKGAVGSLILDARRVAMVIHGDDSPMPRAVRTLLRSSEEAPNELADRMLLALLDMETPSGHWRIYRLDHEHSEGDLELPEALRASSEVVTRETAVDSMLASATAGALPVDLRVQSLARRGGWKALRGAVLGCAAAIAVLFMVLSIHLRVQNARYAGAITELEAKKNDIYRSVFHRADVNAAPSLRLRSERIKLEGLTDSSADTVHSALQDGLATLRLLADVVGQVPEGMRIRVDRLAVDDDGVNVAGQTTAHGAAGDLVRQLNKLDGVAASPPRTKLRKDKTVDFRIAVVKEHNESSE